MAKKRRGKAKRNVTQQVRDIQKRYKKTTARITKDQEKVVTAIMMLAQTRASFYTPQDTNALINSQYRRIVNRKDAGIVGRVGYTQSYALALHENTNWSPKPPGSPGKRGGGYNPNATPRYLERGFDEERDNIQRVIKEQNKL